jgi:hypothetical protein
MGRWYAPGDRAAAGPSGATGRGQRGAARLVPRSAQQASRRTLRHDRAAQEAGMGNRASSWWLPAPPTSDARPGDQYTFPDPDLYLMNETVEPLIGIVKEVLGRACAIASIQLIWSPSLPLFCLQPHSVFSSLSVL